MMSLIVGIEQRGGPTTLRKMGDALTDFTKDIKQSDDSWDLEAWLQPSEASSPLGAKEKKKGKMFSMMPNM